MATHAILVEHGLCSNLKGRCGLRIEGNGARPCHPGLRGTSASKHPPERLRQVLCQVAVTMGQRPSIMACHNQGQQTGEDAQPVELLHPHRIKQATQQADGCSGNPCIKVEVQQAGVIPAPPGKHPSKQRCEHCGRNRDEQNDPDARIRLFEPWPTTHPLQQGQQHHQPDGQMHQQRVHAAEKENDFGGRVHERIPFTSLDSSMPVRRWSNPWKLKLRRL